MLERVRTRGPRAVGVLALLAAALGACGDGGDGAPAAVELAVFGDPDGDVGQAFEDETAVDPTPDGDEAVVVGDGAFAMPQVEEWIERAIDQARPVIAVGLEGDDLARFLDLADLEERVPFDADGAAAGVAPSGLPAAIGYAVQRNGDEALLVVRPVDNPTTALVERLDAAGMPVITEEPLEPIEGNGTDAAIRAAIIEWIRRAQERRDDVTEGRTEEMARAALAGAAADCRGAGTPQLGDVGKRLTDTLVVPFGKGAYALYTTVWSAHDLQNGGDLWLVRQLGLFEPGAKDIVADTPTDRGYGVDAYHFGLRVREGSAGLATLLQRSPLATGEFLRDRRALVAAVQCSDGPHHVRTDAGAARFGRLGLWLSSSFDADDVRIYTINNDSMATGWQLEIEAPTFTRGFLGCLGASEISPLRRFAREALMPTTATVWATSAAFRAENPPWLPLAGA